VTQIFISHVTEQAKLAVRLKRRITEDFLGQIMVFVSSDTESISAGDIWFASLGQALRESNLFIVLCSPQNVERPWVNFELGAAWMRSMPVIPICFGGLEPCDLTMPLLAYEALELGVGDDLLKLYKRIAQTHGCQVPPRKFGALAAELTCVPDQPADREDVAELNTDKAIRSRLDEGLMHPRFKWRSLDKLAVVAAVPVNTARAILQNDERVRFSRGRSGNTIVGLRSRVG
jgi:hypothetical protein